ncbi:MAG: hypothetical protein V4585_20700 [Bacteroidota bacterium]
MNIKFSFLALFLSAFLFMQCSSEQLLENEITPAKSSAKVSAQNLYRGVYLDSLQYIVGNATKENNLLEWCQVNNFTTVTCYDLYTILQSSANYPKMANFIKKAKNIYGIQTVTACMGSASAFTGLINNYNVSRIDPIEKFNYSNLELEWWNNASTYKNYLTQLKGIKAWGDKQSTRIPTEEYIGWFKNPTGQDSTQAAGLVQNSDRILVHDYQTTPSFGYMQSRFSWVGKAAKAQNKIMPIIVIFSVEPTFSYNYFLTNSFENAYNTIVNQFNMSSFNGKANIELIGYQVFDQSYARKARPLVLL